MTIILDGTNGITSPGTLTVQQILSAQTALTGYLLPSDADKWRGVYRAGFDWWSRNQQWGGPWGGEMLDAATGTLYKAEFATGYIESSSSTSVGDAAATTYFSTGFMVAETQTVSAVWVKLYKTGNPTNNLGVFIYSDSAGSPNALITNGTATAQSGKLHTSDTNGAWYRFVLPTPPTLTGGTQYHIVLKSSGAVDASNYWNPMLMGSKKYPFGFRNYGSAVPAWTQQTTNSGVFLVELSSTAQISQSSGIFDGKLAFGGSGASGTLSMSRGLCSSVPLHELIDLNEFTLRVAGTAFTKDATILDIGYGQDHDRIVLRSAVTTGYATLTVYESDGTVHTVTGTTDISSGTQDIGIHVRAKADGSDKVELYVNGASQGTPLTSQTITFDANFRNLGTMWVGGGFALAVTDTQKLTMASLPSANSWTWTGTGTEANCMSVSANKLYQNKNGYASTDSGYYNLTGLSLTSSAGWQVRTKLRIAADANTKASATHRISIHDDTYRWDHDFHEYFGVSADAGTNAYPQSDNKSAECAYTFIGKGQDAFVFRNHKLLIDGTKQNVNAGTPNRILWGDLETTAGENADVVTSYFSYYTTAWTPPQFTSGSISELAIWSGDKTNILVALYNTGTPISVKQYCGLPQNYIDKLYRPTKLAQRGITYTSTTTSTTPVTIAELELFVIGSELDCEVKATVSTTTAGDGVYCSVVVDGVVPGSSFDAGGHQVAVNNYFGSTAHRSLTKTYAGLHKINGMWKVPNGNTGSTPGTLRGLTVISST